MALEFNRALSFESISNPAPIAHQSYDQALNLSPTHDQPSSHRVSTCGYCGAQFPNEPSKSRKARKRQGLLYPRKSPTTLQKRKSTPTSLAASQANNVMRRDGCV